ncbi:MAG TPA: hypothetical protein VGN11_01275 [Candidatus Baltobacteraceae bacterium]|nr:hypothetical protein [Candidatus Baltobacteraceae bacterium]
MTDGGWDDEEDKGPPQRTYSDAEAAADLARYYSLKRSVSFRTLSIAAILGLVCAHWLPIPALALACGGVCGVLNALATMSSGERLVETRRIGGFVLSSFLRIAVFGIVPVAFAAVGPWWAMAWYFAGFFLPLGLFSMEMRRAR